MLKYSVSITILASMSYT